MTQDKELLLKDICARLPYGIKVSYHIETNSTICGDYEELNAEGISDISSYKKINLFIVDGYVASIENIKPYLFPLSSMTDKQKIELTCIIDSDYAQIDWYNRNHLDYRGLIPKGLAIDATGLNIY